MSKDLYQAQTVAYRIYDPVEQKFCCSGRGLYAHNGRSVWLSKAGASVALRNMPAQVKARARIRTFNLVERDLQEGEQ
jgi:hypothetical protein